MDRLFTDPTTWKLHRLTGLPLTIEQTERTVTSPQSLGIRLSKAVRPPMWRFALPPRPDRDPRSPDFQRTNPRSLTCPTEGDLDAWLDASATGYDRVRTLADADPTDPVLQTELPHFKKLTQQVGVDFAWFLSHGFGAGRTGRELPGELHDALKHVLTLYRDFPVTFTAGPDPVDSNPGWPCFAGGVAGRLVSHMITGTDPAIGRVSNAADFFARSVGMSQHAVLGYGLSGRSGPLYKDSPLYFALGNDHFAHALIGKGWKQRNRVVQMAPPGLNRPVRPLYSFLSNGRRQMRETWHAGAPTPNGFASLPYQYEVDFAGFDASVSPELQDAVLDAIIRVVPSLRPVASLWRWAETRPLLMPHWGYERDHCSIASYEGTTHSGLKLTAEMGTLIAVAASLVALQRQGYPLRHFPWSTGHLAAEIEAAHLGDDGRFATARPLDEAQFTADMAQMGIKAELIRGDGFLARHRGPTVWDAPIMGRLIQQTLSNEHAETGRAALGLHYLGFIARTQHVERLPESLLNIGWPILLTAEWVARAAHRLKANSLPEFRSALMASPDARAEIEKAIKRAEGMSWLQQQARDASHSAAAAAIMRIVSELGPADARARSAPMLIDALGFRVARLSAHDRQEWARRGYEAVTQGNMATDAYLAKLYTKLRLSLSTIDLLNDQQQADTLEAA